MLSIQVKTPHKIYPIYFGREICREIIAKNILGKKSRRVAVITGEQIYKLHASRIQSFFPSDINPVIIQVPDGEKYKNAQTALTIIDQLFEAELTREDIIFCIGGGVIGDMGSFCASIYLRGLSVIQIPTTLLAMVDSSVGGKTGINHQSSKNSVGTFYQPDMVIADTAFLDTLPERELKSGFAEIIKHALIADADMFKDMLQKRQNIKNLFISPAESLIKQACQIKADVVSQDERETGLRMTLNFGHTLAHAIEPLTQYSVYLHGECVFAGMEFAAYFSYTKKLISENDYRDISDLLTAFALPVKLPADFLMNLPQTLGKDKKNRASGLNFILLERIGQAKIEKISIEEITNAFRLFLSSGKSNIICM